MLTLILNYKCAGGQLLSLSLQSSLLEHICTALHVTESLTVAVMMVRVRRAQWLALGMLTLSLLLVVLGIYTTTRAESLNVSGYISGVIVSFVCPLIIYDLFSEVTARRDL